ncbi:epidermal growth factor receptor [Lates japonicus]|uniref:Epidermal growth factor receptor n=1 Tax=Lates japonicus TaxID=270547 RepID=A0AAD3RJB1_LATJO|nr:epidermal growth factor receptor [Lates japonicus]GLD72584.1 epidermal growth factor receptor [Lates japonicus]GLD72768.1 epidermal growth factor receptor [Lates japonicus]
MAACSLRWIGLISVLCLGSCDLQERKGKVCHGATNSLNLLGSVENHYLVSVKTYSNCTVILENLEITHMQRHQDLSFLRSIEEVGGYVLIAFNTAPRIPLENLRIIRGRSRFNDTFALAVFANSDGLGRGTQELLLPSLTGLSDLNKAELCAAVIREVQRAFTERLLRQALRRRLHGTPTHRLPGERGICRSAADKAQHEGSDDGLCKDSCPSLVRYDPNLYQLVPNPRGKYHFGATCVKSCPLCHGLGSGDLTHTLSINASNIDSFRNCTKITGCVAIIVTSIHGDEYTKTPKMDPAQLHVFKTVKEITVFQDFSFLSLSDSGSRSLVISHLGVGHLGLRSLREISDGDVVVVRNQNLCYTEESHWTGLFKSKTQRVAVEGNADAETCGTESGVV